MMDTNSQSTQRYDAEKYKKPSVTVDVALFNISRADDRQQLKLLLIRRGNEPYKGSWALPGGFVDCDENLRAAARRELKEETGLDVNYLRQLYTWGDVGRDPRTRVISVSYIGLVDTLSVQAGDDAADAKWFTVQADRPVPELIKITLTSGNDRAQAQVAVKQAADFDDVCWEIMHNDGLAFDHAKIIACALQAIRPV